MKQINSFLEDFLDFTSGGFSPEIFRKWCGLSLIGAACQRRVWVEAGGYQTFPNLYIMLVAPPGVGKQCIDEIRDLLAELPPAKASGSGIFLSPDSMTKASMVDSIAKARTLWVPPSGPPEEFHSLYIVAEEAGVFLPAYDLEFLATLNRLYNSPATPHIETRRHGPAREVKIEKAQINMIAGTQPGWMSSVFPEEAWSLGFASRIIMIYNADNPIKSLFDLKPKDLARKKNILSRLHKISSLWGKLPWAAGALEHLNKWHMAGGPPQPTHTKLEHYNRRRTLHVIKLSIISALSRSLILAPIPSVETEDIEQAIEWLIEAEGLMPDIFRAMVGRSDSQILEELHFFVISIWKMNSGKPVPAQKLRFFLSQRVPSDKVEKLLELAERAGFLVRVAGQETYLPGTRDGGFVE